MKVKVAIVLGLAAVGMLAAPVAGYVSSADAASRCVTKRGKGWAWTEDMARFQAWEIVAQLSGNWPVATDTLRNERYKCKKDGSGYTCLSWIDVCKS
ncbi:MAG TPA: hypothetical protein VFF87_05280 [Hyphomicrobium sp.]|nr:hypothetical protein [Hyphomicrobium sp.]